MLVVTGASGLLGACVLQSAVERGWDAVGLYHRHAIQSRAVQSASVNLTDHSATRRLITDVQPDTIIHCAAATDVDWCEAHPKEADAINANASANLAEIARSLSSKFVYISTDAVFDGKKGNYAEIDEPAPLNFYASSKLEGERETLRRNPSALVVRVNIYGWNAQEKNSLAEWVLKKLEVGATVPGFTDVFFTPILVNDLVSVLFSMLQGELTGLYHVAGAQRISKFEFARKIAQTFGFDPGRVEPCGVKDAALKAPRPRDISLNTEKISAALGRMMPGVDSGLLEFRRLRDQEYPQRLKSYLCGETYA